jgi:hypothetical protein
MDSRLTLFDLEITPKVAQTIFRHSDASTMEESLHSVKIAGRGPIRNERVTAGAKLCVTINQSRRSSVGGAADS